MSDGPTWWRPLADGARMRATDAWAIEQLQIASLELMERAGEGLARLVDEVAPDGAIAVVCGKGNNGGDGYVAARLLRAAGRDVRVLTTIDPGELAGDAKANLDALPGASPEPFAAAAFTGVAVVVDAILGTGFAGEPRGPAAEAIAALRDLDALVVAADIPSGVDASSGAAGDTAVRATATATFHAAKAGMWIHPGKALCGDVRVVDIGIPDGAPVEPPELGLITSEILRELPARGAASTKFSSGHVLVAGASRGLTGAAILSARAAARAGAGYVTCCVPASLETIFEIALLEVMSKALPDDDGAHVERGAAIVCEEARRRGGAIVLGGGLGRSAGAVAFARTLAREAPAALVLDADGLNAHAAGDDGEAHGLRALADRAHPTILTPHPGELARLLGVDGAAIKAQRLDVAREAARLSGAVVVLKGDDSLVAAPDGRVAVSAGGAPALATAGTGDVLAGIAGAYLAVGLDAFTAASAAVHAHVLAGQRAAQPAGPGGVIASDVVAALPGAVHAA